MFEQRSKPVYVVSFLQYFLIIIKSSSSFNEIDCVGGALPIYPDQENYLDAIYQSWMPLVSDLYV